MASTKSYQVYFINGVYRTVTWFLIWFVFSTVCLSSVVYSMETPDENHFHYSLHFEDGFLLKDFISAYPEREKPLTVEDILLIPDSHFYTSKDLPLPFDDVENYWVRFKIINDTDEKRTDYIGGALGFDSLEVYSEKDGQLTFELLTGYNVNPQSKRTPSRRNLFNYELNPGQSIQFYIRVYPSYTLQDQSMLNFFILEDFYSMYIGFFYQTMSRIFLGSILFLFSLFSLVMFFSFKERVFIFYSLFMLFLALYFLENQHILDLLYFIPGKFLRHWGNHLLIAGVLVFGYLFISRYLKLKVLMPRLNRFFLALTVFVSVYSITHFNFFYPNHIFLGSIILNLLVLLYIIIYFVPITLLSIKGNKQARILFYSMVLMFIGAIIFTLSLLTVIPLTDFTRNSFQWGVVAFSGTLFYGLFDKINSIQKDKIQFRVEKEKTDELLFNILPYEVATELKEKGFCEARDYSKVNVLFTDFKDFTATSSQLSAKELVHEVNSCFVAFDHIIEKYKIEKIKTIGDSYMAASGLVSQAGTKVKDIVLAALEMQEFLNKRKEEHNHRDFPAFEMRVGIHSGPVIAGIVGVKKFQYDLWGDTVNTASRLESYGEVGKVNISDTTYQSIKDDPEFAFEKREEIEVKGKGKLNMWFVSKSSIV